MATTDPEPFVLPQDQSHSDAAMQKMLQLQTDGTFTDFKIKVEGRDEVINCHKLVLAATCQYFESLFNTNMKEVQQGEVTMKSLNFDILHALILYLYTSRFTVKWKDVVGAVEACDLLLLPKLRDQLVEYICKHVDVGSCISWYQFADNYNLKGLAKRAKKLMCTQFEEVSTDKEFKSLSLSEVIDYITDKELEVKSPDSLLYAVMEWVEHDPQERTRVLINLLKLTKMDSCTPLGMETLTDKYKHLIVDPEVKTLIYETIIPMFKKMNKGASEKRLVILGGMRKYDGDINQHCWVLNGVDISSASAQGLKWEKFAEFPSGSQAKQSPVVTLPGGFAVLCGGQSQKETTMYNAAENKWWNLPPLPNSFTNLSALYCDNSIYAFDGRSARVFCLHLPSSKWHEKPKKLKYDCWPIAVAIDADIYVISQNKCQHYNTSSSVWTYKCDLPLHVPNSVGACLMTSKDSLYLVGGHTHICAQYKINDNSWTMLTQPSLLHGFGSAVEVGGKIYVFGGCDAGSNEIEEYNIAADKWMTLQLKLPMPLQFFSAAMVDFM